MKMGGKAPDYSNLMVFVVVLIVMGIVGLQVMGAVSEQIGTHNNLQNQRAAEAYGDGYVSVSSDDCYETCVLTYDDPDRRELAILIAADRRVGWVNELKLSEAVPGHSVSDTVDGLVAEGLLIKQGGTIPEYKYVGKEGKYERGLSDAELRERITEHLYVTDAWLTMDELKTSVPAADWRVEKAVHELENEGTIRSGQEAEGSFIAFEETAYAHTDVTREPYNGVGGVGGLLPVVGVILIAVIAIGLIQRYRLGDKNPTDGA